MTKKLLKISRYKPSILQGKFEFSAGSTPVSLSLEHPRERIILYTLGAILTLLICAYLYFITASVLNVMARKEALMHINSIEGDIGALEHQYLALSGAAGPQAAVALGLAPVSETQYVYRPGNVGAATIAGNAN